MGKKPVLILLTCFFVFSFAKVRPTTKEKINWLTIEELNLKLNQEPRPVFIDLYTDWCYWCKVMDKKTYNNPKVTAYINDHFYALKLNAETKDNIKWNSKEYKFNVSNKVNDFALYITNGQMEFPTMVIFPDVQKVPASIPGFMDPKEIEPILKYFGEGKYNTQNYEEFSKTFKKTW
ncbi:MAG: DUF255 domain-containing protein [Ginsengibacter sp.]